MKTLKYIGLMLMLFSTQLKAQEEADSLLSLDQAISIAMVNNYDLKVATNQLEQAQNSNSIGNAGLLPSLSLNGVAEYQKSDTEMEFINNPERNSIDDAVTKSYNGNIRMDYTLFDGLGNVYTLQKLRDSDERQQTLFKQQMEVTMMEVIENYYEVCRAQENLDLALRNMQVSRDRYNRAIDQKEFGQATLLDVLNAEVDLNSDSTTILNVEQSFLMAVKNLNLSLGIPIATEYAVNDSISFRNDLNSDDVISAALVNNTSLLSQQQLEQLTDLDFKITRANRYPTLSAYGQYGYNRQESDAGVMAFNQTDGLTTGVTLKLNVFNGRQQRTQEKNAKLSYLSEQERTRQLEAQVERDASNAYTDYTYKRRIVELQKSSLQQAKHNFEQTKEMYQLGRVNSIEFRTAQQNLLSVAYNYSEAQLNAKIAEFYLLRMTGDLVNDKQ